MAISAFLDQVRDRVSLSDEPAPEDPDHLPEDPGDDLPEDPAPARKAGRRAKVGGTTPPKITAGQRKSVADALTMMIDMPAAIFAFKDPVCGGAILAQSDEVVKKLTPIVCRNPALLAWLTSGAGYMDWFGLITALAPIAKTVWQHHVVRHDDDTSEGSAPDGSRPDFSRYTAPSLA